MSLPLFYIADYNPAQKEIILDEDTSKHVVQVLRMKSGDKLNLSDGKGNLLTCEIIDDHRKHCSVKIIDSRLTSHGSRKITIAISLLKNANRFEWFLEKATEIGISEIIPIICERTEKEKFRLERVQGIIISAMLQSQQAWLPELHEPIPFKKVVELAQQQQKFIAHCMEGTKADLADLTNPSLNSQIILIGPEGDFTKEEVDMAIRYHFTTVSLGNTRLRSETAGMVAATMLKLA